MNDSVNALASWALETSAYAAALVLLVIAAQSIFGKLMSPKWRYGLSLLILVRLLLPISPESRLSITNLLHSPAPELETASPSTRDLRPSLPESVGLKGAALAPEPALTALPPISASTALTPLPSKERR